MKKILLALLATAAISSPAWAATPAEREMHSFDYVQQVSNPPAMEKAPEAEPAKAMESAPKHKAGKTGHKHAGKKAAGKPAHHHKHAGKAAAGKPAHHHKHAGKTAAPAKDESK